MVSTARGRGPYARGHDRGVADLRGLLPRVLRWCQQHGRSRQLHQGQEWLCPVLWHGRGLHDPGQQWPTRCPPGVHAGRVRRVGACELLLAAVVDGGMSEDAYENRENLNISSLCGTFMAKFGADEKVHFDQVRNEIEAEKQRRAQEEAEEP